MASPDEIMKSYAELYSERDAIFWLFHDRCVMCGQKAEEVNEIVPRARTRHAKQWRNQVTLCHSCHQEYHHNGVTHEKQSDLFGKRESFLVTIGREQYI